MDISLCSFFKRPYKSFVPDKAFKKALEKVLVDYYPLAGEFVTGATGETEVLCNNRGVALVLAEADVELHVADQSVAMFVPKKKHGVITIQATELKCGSLVISCTFDHRIVDGYSVNMFFVSLAEAIRSQPLSFVPSFERSLLNPRRPLLIDSSLDLMFMPASSLPPPPDKSSPKDVYTGRVYYIKSNVMEQLQALASSEGCHRTKLESFSAFLWKVIAKHAHEKDDPNKATSKLGVVVDGRRRVSEHETEKMKTYFGNVLSIPFGKHGNHDLIEKPLSWVANEVHKFLETAMTKDHFMGLIDYVELHRPEPLLSRVFQTGSDEGPALVVSSGRNLWVTKADFGWGPPVFGSCHFLNGSSSGYVLPIPSPSGNGDWFVYLQLTQDQLKFIEVEASHVFQPITCDYLGINGTV